MNAAATRLAVLVVLAAGCAASALPATAAANVPPPLTVTNEMRISTIGDAAYGTLSTTLTYTDTTATATASTGNTIGLGKGNYFRLSTCVAYHLYGAVPVSSCARRFVDTRDASATEYTYAPSVTLAGQRPSGPAPWGYFTAYSEVAQQVGSALTLVAHTWPDTGLQGAGLAVAAQDATTATLPPNQPFTVDGAFSGAINTGQPDSICTGEPGASNGSALPAGVTDSHAAFPDAPAYYEVGLPTGAYGGLAPRGVMLVVHGGAWVFNGIGAVEGNRPEADRWRARGFETVNLTYRPCGQSFDDVLWFYDQARAWFGASAKICATGQSAGGTLSLLLAVRRPDVYCVINQAGPTDLRAIQTEPAYNATTGAFDQLNGGRLVRNLATAAFGEENLGAFSPAAWATGSLKSTRVLQGFSADDPLVPWGQAIDLRDAMLAADPAAYVDTDQLEQGTVAFGHGRVTEVALDDYRAREEQLVAPVVGSTVPLAAP